MQISSDHKYRDECQIKKKGKGKRQQKQLKLSETKMAQLAIDFLKGIVK